MVEQEDRTPFRRRGWARGNRKSQDLPVPHPLRPSNGVLLGKVTSALCLPCAVRGGCGAGRNRGRHRRRRTVGNFNCFDAFHPNEKNKIKQTTLLNEIGSYY